MLFDRRFLDQRRRLRYTFEIDVPVYDDRRSVTVQFTRTRSAVRPRVRIDGPRCLRHRFHDDSLCMWWEGDAEDDRWVLQDGLIELARQAMQHAYCEAECRAGRPWPKQESPGTHPRPPGCPSCSSSAR